MSMLYRGVSCEMYESEHKGLRPKGTNARIVMQRDDFDRGLVLRRDGTFDRDYTENNAVRAHHLETGAHDGCFVSTTRSCDIAKQFATKNGIRDGWVLVLDESKFEERGVIARRVNDNRYPNEQEVSIRDKDCGDISQEVVVRALKVSADGSTCLVVDK